jgi:hypothetical protein
MCAHLAFTCDDVVGAMRGVEGDTRTDATAVKLARNEALFREINERVGELSDRWGSAPNDFVCECSRLDCHAAIAMTHAEYETVRGAATRFLVRPGHEISGIERVVETNDRYAVVEKIGTGGAVAADADPRGRS